MTIENAIDALKNNWWKYWEFENENESKDDFDVAVGDLIKEIQSGDIYYSEIFYNSFLFNFAIYKKGSQPTEDDWYKFGVLKKNGDCILHIELH